MIKYINLLSPDAHPLPRIPNDGLWRSSIPRFSNVIDVDYVDITECPVTDPARLLTEHSMTPLHIEDRRRETFYHEIIALVDNIERILSKFDRESLRMPRGIDHCPYEWENKAYESICDAFFVLTETIQDALSVFNNTARTNAWQLWEFCGCDDSEYIKAFLEEKEALNRFLLQIDFLNAINRLSYQDNSFLDDLPF